MSAKVSGPARVGEGEVALGLHRLAELVAEMERVRHRLRVLDFAAHADNAGLAAAFEPVTRDVEHHARQEPAHAGRDFVDFGAQVLHIAPPEPGVADDRDGGGQQRGGLQRLAAFLMGVLHMGQRAADDGGGECGDHQANSGMTLSMKFLSERFCTAISSPMEA